MWDFEHPPLAAGLAQRYQLHYTVPSRCADELLGGRADLGLIPIAALTSSLAIVPCAAPFGPVRREALPATGLTPQQLTEDLNHSRTHGLANIEALVREWTPRIALPPATIRHYLTQNIHYTLTDDCIRTIQLF